MFDPDWVCPPEGYWTTQDGRELRIADMDTSHAESTLAMLERENLNLRPEFRSKIPELREALAAAGVCGFPDETPYQTSENQ
jgi:hypothetical protein